jgi:hypothetical protein
MASYTDLIRKITTAEINRVQREGGYERWAYFVDGRTGKAGAIFASTTRFAAYEVTDTPDPKLIEYGNEALNDIRLTPNPEMLVIAAGDNVFRASVFSDPAVLIDDEFTDAYTNDSVQDWQRYLHTNGAPLADNPRHGLVPKIALGVIALLVIAMVIIGLL